MMNVIRNLDAFGSPVNINFKGDTSVKSLPGALLTMLLYSVTLYVAVLSTNSMLKHDDPTITNYHITTSEEEMIEESINFPEWHADIAVGFLDGAASRIFTIPPNIGQVKFSVMSVENYEASSKRNIELRLEKCRGNSFYDSDWWDEV